MPWAGSSLQQWATQGPSTDAWQAQAVGVRDAILLSPPYPVRVPKEPGAEMRRRSPDGAAAAPSRDLSGSPVDGCRASRYRGVARCNS